MTLTAPADIATSASVPLLAAQATPHPGESGACQAHVWHLVHAVSRVTVESGDLDTLLHGVLQAIQPPLQVVRGMISLFEAASGTPLIHASVGLSDTEAASGIYPRREDMVRQVLASCPPQSMSAKDASGVVFVCVPIQHHGRVLGTLCVERADAYALRIHHDTEILTLLATTMAQTVALFLREQVEQTALEAENRQLRRALQDRLKPCNMIGHSRPMLEVFGLIEKVSRAQTCVLILGEAGVGKELVASAIHYNSRHADGPFVKFNCAALPEAVLEAELFGQAPGAFAQHTLTPRGRFEEAGGGTLFLDEIGALSLPMQARLLRVLQEKSLVRAGSPAAVALNCRVLAASRVDLWEWVRKGRFREDLYHRLNVFALTLPPLRSRGSDIAALANHFLSRYCADMGVEVNRIAPPAMNVLTAYHWPGNVRELEHVIERAILLASHGVIDRQHLPPSLQTPVASVVSAEGSLDARLSAIEYNMIDERLTQHQGNMSETAHSLGLTRRILGLRMAKYHLDYRDYR